MSTDVHQGLLVKSQLLYQLSYAGAPAIVFAESSSACCRGHPRPPALLSKLLSNRKTVVKSTGVETGKILEFRTSSSTPIDARIRLYWRRLSRGLPRPDVVPWASRIRAVRVASWSTSSARRCAKSRRSSAAMWSS